MFKEIKTYGDLVKAIQENNLEDKAIILQEINDFIVLSDSCGNYEEDLFRQEQLKEEEN